MPDRGSTGPTPASAPEPGARSLEAGPRVRLYVARVQEVCRRYDRRIQASGKVPIATIARSESAVTSRIASIPAPPAAREIRHALLRARRRLDQTAVRGYRLMSRSADPEAAYEDEIAPLARRRAHRMYETFGSFGIDCSTSS